MNSYKRSKKELFNLKNSDLINPKIMFFHKKRKNYSVKAISKEIIKNSNQSINNNQLGNNIPALSNRYDEKNLFFTEIIGENNKVSTKRRPLSVSSNNINMHNKLIKSQNYESCDLKDKIKENNLQDKNEQEYDISHKNGNLIIKNCLLENNQTPLKFAKSSKYLIPSKKLPNNLKLMLNNFKSKKIKIENIKFNINNNSNNEEERLLKITKSNKKLIFLGRNKIKSNSESKKTNCKFIDINLTNRDSICPYNGYLKNEVINLLSNKNFISREQIVYSNPRKTPINMFKVYKNYNKKLLTYSGN